MDQRRVVSQVPADVQAASEPPVRPVAAGRCSGPVVFFFSSRRRHTRCSRDWSSDVCSSDLIVTRAVVVEKDEGKWSELLRCDEHLKNQKGFLGMTPLAAVTGWRLQYEQSEGKGLELYFTPLKGVTDSHVLPIGVRWNPGTKR